MWDAIVLLIQVFLVALWLALAFWTYRDARRRLESPALVAAAVALAVVIPFLGPIIWLVLRPPESLEEARERELEVVALERRLAEEGGREGRETVARLTGGDPGELETEGLRSALSGAGMVTREDLQDLDLRLTELEFRLRGLDARAAPAPVPDAAPSEPEGDTGRRARATEMRATEREARAKRRRDRDRSRPRPRSQEDLYE